ncbi:hypothetical protein GCM10023189_06920 [Nibrella saemangeumensis]|uniref:Uncharacterized protein n=1 Tax=Nibrella saemangeumensis TaxID=1084526 RepID=A0ABP8MF71_9BACT
MDKAEWYKHLFNRIDVAIENLYFFEAAFIAYGIIEDRLTSMLRQLELDEKYGVGKKINAIVKEKSTALEAAFGLKGWDGGKYTSLGLLGEVLKWGELYRNPLQHILGDPRHYHATFGGFHIQNTKDLAVEGRLVARNLSSAVMRFKKMS